MTEPPKLEDFPSTDYDKLRFGDLDMLGHVNNTIYAELFSTGRTTLLNHPGINAWTNAAYTYVIARLEIDYRAETFWPGLVQVGTAVKSVGRSSLVLTQALYQAQKCVATAQVVMVQVDKTTHKPLPFSDESRAILLGLTLKECA